MSLDILNDVVQPKKRETKSLTAGETWKETNLIEVITVTADVLAPFGARASAGTVMTKLLPHTSPWVPGF